MAHWAELDENNIVTNVIVTSNELDDEGQTFVNDVIGGTWVKTSINTIDGVHYSDELDEDENRIPSADQSKALRGNFAGIGMTYDAEADEFIQTPDADGVVITGGPEDNTGN